MELSAYANDSQRWREFQKAVPEELMAGAALRKYKADSLICLRDTSVQHIHMVLSGTVSAQNITFSGKVSCWLNMPSPTFVGDLELMAEHSCYAAHVMAVTDCTLAYWPTARFMETAMKYPELLLLVARVLARKEYELSVSRGQTVFLSNLERTAMYLLQYCEAAPPSPQYVVQKTRNEISSEVFFSPKTLERCLYRLRDAGMLSISRGKVHISREQLELLEKFRDTPDSI